MPNAATRIQAAWNELHVAADLMRCDKLTLAEIDLSNARINLMFALASIREKETDFWPGMTDEVMLGLGIRGACDAAMILAKKLNVAISDDEAKEQVRIQRIINAAKL